MWVEGDLLGGGRGMFWSGLVSLEVMMVMVSWMERLGLLLRLAGGTEDRLAAILLANSSDSSPSS